MNKRSNDEIQLTDKRPGFDPPGVITKVSPPATTDVSIFQCGNPTLKWGDLSDEQYRVYVWPNGWKVTLYNPMKLNVSASGGHRVFTADGFSHYIPSGWNHLYWLVKPGEDHFAF